MLNLEPEQEVQCRCGFTGFVHRIHGQSRAGCRETHRKSPLEKYYIDGIYNDFRLTFQANDQELESKDIPLTHLAKL